LPPSQYLGSFMVEDLDLQQQAGRLEEQLRALKVGHPPPGSGGTPNSGGDPQLQPRPPPNAVSLPARTAPGGDR